MNTTDGLNRIKWLSVYVCVGLCLPAVCGEGVGGMAFWGGGCAAIVAGHMNHSYSIDSIFSFFSFFFWHIIIHAGWKIWPGAPDINLHGDKLRFPRGRGVGMVEVLWFKLRHFSHLPFFSNLKDKGREGGMGSGGWGWGVASACGASWRRDRHNEWRCLSPIRTHLD